MTIDHRYLDVCELVYLNHDTLYSWNNIVQGQRVGNKSFAAVEQNTFRGFHRCNKDSFGAKFYFVKYFTENKDVLIGKFNEVQNKADYEQILNDICTDMKNSLRGVIVDKHLHSYNKLRKPVDLYVQHLISMSKETKYLRSKLTPFMGLPLDSQIFQSQLIFTEQELRRNNLTRRSSYGNVSNADCYNSLQNLIIEKSSEISLKLDNRKFYPIYFDLLWSDRINRKGSNLFEMNPGK